MKTVTLILCVMVASASFASENLVVNGDFETPDIPLGWTWFSAGVVPGWTVEVTFPGQNEYPPRLEMWDHLMGPAYSGNQHVELDSFDPTKISQAVSTTPGNRYELSYAWGPRPGVLANQMKVWVDGVEIADHSASGVGDINVSWTAETHQFVATGGSTVIAFAEVGPDDQLGMLLDAVSLILVEIDVEIDIKPGSDPNSININGGGVIPVAVLGSADLDVAQIDVTTLAFAGLAVRVKGNGNPQCSIKDVNGDGIDDLVCQFVDDPAYWSPGEDTATLTGNLLDGTAIQGTDSIKIVPE